MRDIYKIHKRPPETVLKTIKGGRLNGYTDISPQWRLEALTDLFGPCGLGWYYTTKEKWTEEGADGEKMVFVTLELFYKEGNEWSKGVEGTGGNTIICKESRGMYNNDEAYKMATTDALSVICKQLGIGSDIYLGMWDGSKYKDQPKETKKNISEIPDTNEKEKRKQEREKIESVLSESEIHVFHELLRVSMNEFERVKSDYRKLYEERIKKEAEAEEKLSVSNEAVQEELPGNQYNIY
jgi:hypothetical protein